MSNSELLHLQAEAVNNNYTYGILKTGVENYQAFAFHTWLSEIAA